MNPSQCTQPEQLFSSCVHAGGWPKLGWQQDEGQDEAMTCYDDIILL